MSPVTDPEGLDPVAQAAIALHQTKSLEDALQEIVDQATRCLPEFEHVTVSRILPEKRLETLAATTDLAREFDRVQSEARGGPCVEAGRLDEIVVVQHARHEQRWAGYIGRAVELGLRSQLGIRLASDARGAICLNLHSTSADDVDAGSVGVAEHFAVHAGLALGHLNAADQLHSAIGTRALIGTAVGLTMERFALTQTQAFSYLVRMSSQQNRKLRVIASEVVQAHEEAVARRQDTSAAN